LAQQLGFRGIDLPCIPNSGGISIYSNTDVKSKTSSRNQIIVKGYGGTFGRIGLALEALSRIIAGFPSMKVFIYSVTDDIKPSVEEFRLKFPSQVSYRTTRDQLSISEIRSKMLLSRIYIGCSDSDGISTSFLEALTCGTFPIQSNTSCASEWVEKGFEAYTVNLDVEELTVAILSALKNDDLVDTAQVINASLAKEYLDVEIVKRKALEFYSSQ
jgi:glycosyltransferase involved in cell wall biosynthesis